MNLYTYLNAKRFDAAQIPDCVFDQTKNLINQIRSLPIPFPKQEQLVYKLLSQFNQDQEDAPSALANFQAQFAEEKEKQVQLQNKWVIDFWDALMAISAFVVLFDVIFEQVIDHQNLMGMMDFGLSNLFGALGLYLICRALIEVILRFDHGIWRWLSLAILFGLFLAIRYVSKYASLSIHFSVIGIAVIFCFIFGLSLWKLNRFYGPKREEKRIQ